MEGGLLSWIAPPAVGAILGWAASSVLLSRILRPGAKPRVPREVSQGPSKFALEMGELVATELLSEEAIRKQLASPGFRDSLRRGTASITERVLSTPVGALSSPSGSERLAPLFDVLREGLERGGMPLLKEIVRAAILRFVRMPVSQLLGEGSLLGSLLDRAARGMLTGETRRALHLRIEAWLDGLLKRETELADYLSPEGVATIEEAADALYPPVIEFLIRWLRSAETKRDLIIRGRFLVRDLLGRLTGIQRIIVSAAQFDRTVDENMPGIVGDALDAIEETARDPETRKRLIAAIGGELRAARSRGLAELIGSNGETVKSVACSLADRLVGFLSDPEGRADLLSFLAGPESAGSPGELSGGGRPSEQTVGELLAGLLRVASKEAGLQSSAGNRALSQGGREEEVAGYLAGLLFAQLEGSRTGGGLSLPALLSEALSARGNDRVGELLALSGGARERLVEALADALVATVDTHLSEILAGVDFRTLVARKIDEVESAEIARSLLGGVGPQLRWIAAFGGLVGALIGAAADLARLV